MTNGQMNVVTMLQSVLVAGPEQIVSSAAATDGIQQDSGVFAGLLNGIQSPAAVKGASDSNQAEQPQGKEHFVRDVSAEELSVDLLALIQGWPQITPASEPAAQQEEPEKAEATTGSASLSSAPAAASQVVLAAYSHSGRMPEVNFPTQHVDGLQNAAAVSEQPPVVFVEKQAEQVTVESSAAASAASGTGQALPVTAQAVHSGRMPEVNTPAPLPVDRLQNAAAAAETGRPTADMPKDVPDAEPVIPTEKQTLKPSVSFAEVQQRSDAVPSSQVDGQAASVKAEVVQVQASQPEQPGRMPVVSTLTTVPGERRHATSPESGKPARTVSVPDMTPVSQPEARPEQAAEIPAGKNAATTAAASTMAPDGATAVDAPVPPVVKAVQPHGISMLKSDAAPADRAVPAPVASPEPDLEIQLAQPRPVTARAVSVPVSADHRVTAMAQETGAVRQRSNPEQEQKQKQGVVNELTSSPQAVVASSEDVAMGSDPSRGDDGTQRQPDAASDNSLSLQDMHGQFKAEHQKAAASSTRPIPAEPVRENISEQVVQQVKERLGQHEVKQGSQQITLTLSPDSLGELKMNLNLQGQKLSVEIVTENKAVRDSIVQHADALKDSLGRQNITMESFDVTTGGKGSGNQGQNQNAWRELAKQQQQQQFWTSTRGYQTVQADLPAGNAAYMKQQGHSMLDIHY